MEIKIDSRSALPVYEQIKRAIKLAIFTGRLDEGDQLTSIRELSLKLKINPNTIIKVYYQLEDEGFITARPGSGYFVKFSLNKIQKEKRELFEAITIDYLVKALELGYSIEDIIQEIYKKSGYRNSIKNSREWKHA